MKANSSTLMKMSIAKRTRHHQGKREHDQRERAEPKRARSAEPPHHRVHPPNRPLGLRASVNEKHQEHHDQPGIGADELNPQRLCDAHHQAGDQRAGDIAQRAQDDGNERHQHEHLADHGIGRVERHQQRAGGARQRQRHADRDAEHAVGIDAHQHRHVAVLRRGAHRLAEIGRVQEDPESPAEHHRDDEGDELCHRDVERTEMDRRLRVRGLAPSGNWP